jgi:hypothetical protein
MSLPMKNSILSPKSSLTPTFLGEILSPKFPRETGREKECRSGNIRIAEDCSH